MSKIGHTGYLSIIGALIVVVFWLGQEPRSNGGSVGGSPLAPESIAILPFKAFSSGESTAEVISKFTENLTNTLARDTTLEVLSRSDVAKFVESGRDISEIDTALSVSLYLEGSVRLDLGRVRVTAQLIDAVTGDHLWSETFDGEEDELQSISIRISEGVSEVYEQRWPGAT